MITRYLISVSEKFGENIGQTTNLTKHTDAEYGIPIFTQKIIHKHRQKSMHGYILIMRYQFLGDGYTVKSSFGHIRDLEKRIWELISNTIFNLNMKSPLIKKRLSKN